MKTSEKRQREILTDLNVEFYEATEINRNGNFYTAFYFKGTDGNFYKFRPLKDMLCIKHTKGQKMDGKISLSTSPLLNVYCKARCNSNNKKCVCVHCFSVRQQKSFKGKSLKSKLIENTYNLTLRKLSLLEITDCKYYLTQKCDGVRFEAFGDIQNSLHLENLFMICNTFTSQSFTLWTKNLHLFNNTADKIGKPKNLILIFSNPLIDTPFNTDSLHLYGLRYVDKVFSVYSENYATDNNIYINCGGRHCATCNRCYNSNNTEKIINEKLK